MTPSGPSGGVKTAPETQSKKIFNFLCSNGNI